MDREEAIKILKSKMDGSVDTSYEWAEAVRMAIEALSAETPTDQQKHQLSEETPTDAPTDLISRADAIKAIESRQTEQWIDADVDYNNGLESAVAEIKALPSADRPSGEWIMQNEELKISDYRCSVCGHYQDDTTDFCPNCGAKMGGK